VTGGANVADLILFASAVTGVTAVAAAIIFTHAVTGVIVIIFVIRVDSKPRKRGF
jgi:hypothetical protein